MTDQHSEHRWVPITTVDAYGCCDCGVGYYEWAAAEIAGRRAALEAAQGETERLKMLGQTFVEELSAALVESRADLAQARARITELEAAIETFMENDSMANWDRMAALMPEDNPALDAQQAADGTEASAAQQPAHTACFGTGAHQDIPAADGAAPRPDA